MTLKILLVDDNENNLLAMCVALKKIDCHFFKANSGHEALRTLLCGHDISLILLDAIMPIMDGYETAHLIYQHDKFKHIPIIFITAQDYEEAAMFKVYQAGAVDFVRKPFNPEILRYKVAIFAELYQKNQLLRKQDEYLLSINRELIQLNHELEQRVQERTLALENLNDELRALNQSKDKFLSVISHDLRNLITAMLASSSKLSEEFEKLSINQIKQLSRIIHRTSNKLLNQLNAVIEWAQKQSQKTNFEPQKIELAEIIEKSLEILKPSAYQKDIKLKYNIPKDIAVKADYLMFRSIIQNLVKNAIKYTPEGGSVKIMAKTKRQMAYIFVKDSGVGITPEIKDQIFKNASQHASSGTNREKGSGLGLLLVNDFITQHGGKIYVESNLGVGTTIIFTLPVIEDGIANSTVKEFNK